MSPPPERLHLRPLEPADGPRVLAWRNAPDVARHMYGDHAIGEAEHARWLVAAAGAQDRRYWIAEADGVPCGVAHVVGMGAHGRGEWGSYLASPQMRGRGIGAAMEFLVLGWAFETAGLRKLWVEVLAENVDAWKLHLDFGFTREADFRAHVVKGGRARDAIGFGMLAAEWPAAKRRAQARLAARGWADGALTIAP